MRSVTWSGLIILLSMLLGFAVPQPAFGDDDLEKYWTDNYGVFNPNSTPDYAWSVNAKAQPDECFFGLGDPDNLKSFGAVYAGLGYLGTGYAPCSYGTRSGGRPKVNQAYIWGLTKHGTDLWIGTVANTLCLVIEALNQNQPSPILKNTVECEGTVAKDARPPRIYVYDTNTQQLADLTPSVLSNGVPHSVRLLSTIGLRSAGSLGDVVILAGINQSGVTMFAFDGKTRQFIDSITFDGQQGRPKYNNIRQWKVVNKQLYVGVATGTSSGFGGSTSGAILHWIGNSTQPFNFETVGTVPGDPAYLTHFKGRLFASTWGVPDSTYGTVLSMSPAFTDKLPACNQSCDWTKVWQLSNYEVEQSASAGGGAIASFDGWLYFSTLIPPGAQIELFHSLYPNAKSDAASLAKDFLGSYRPTTLFRGKDFGTPKQKIELLYGTTLLPKYNSSTDTWSLIPNKLQQSPKWGLTGYNNPFNSYTWWMSKFNGELFIGTFDWSYLLFESIFDQYGSQIPPAVIAAARSYEGADLLRLHSSSDSPVFVSVNGMGNYSNYGIRTMIKTNGQLYLGTANPFNLFTDPVNDPYGKTGGWELIRLWATGSATPGPDNDDD